MFFTSHIYAWDFWGVSWFCFDLKKEKNFCNSLIFPLFLLELYHNKNRGKKKKKEVGEQTQERDRQRLK